MFRWDVLLYAVHLTQVSTFIEIVADGLGYRVEVLHMLTPISFDSASERNMS